MGSHAALARLASGLLISALCFGHLACSRATPPKHDGLTDFRGDTAADSGIDSGRDLSPDLGRRVREVPQRCSVDSVCVIYPDFGGEDLHDVALFAPTNSYLAVGDNGTLLRHDTQGKTWQLVGDDLEAVQHDDLRGIWTSAKAAWVVGDGGTVLRYDGERAILEKTDTKRQLNAVWGDASGEALWAVGVGGTILRRSAAATWKTVPSPSSAKLEALWGAGPNALFAVGAQGTFLRYDGSSWAKVAMPASLSAEHFKSVFGRSASEVYAVSLTGRLLRFDGQEARLGSGPTAGKERFIVDLWGDAKALYALRTPSVLRPASSSEVLRFDGLSWSVMGAGLKAALWAVAPTKPNAPNSVLAVGLDAVVSHFDGKVWSPAPQHAQHERAWGNIAVDTKGGIWVVGSAGAPSPSPFAIRGDEQTWQPVSAKALPTLFGRMALDPQGAPYVLASSYGTMAPPAIQSSLWRYDGTKQWSEVPTGLQSAGGPSTMRWLPSQELVVGGEAGELRTFDGTNWSDIKGSGTPPQDEVARLWGSSAKELWAVSATGDGGAPTYTAHSFRSGVWAAHPFSGVLKDSRVNGIWGRSHSEVYLPTDKGLLRWNGGSWKVALAPPDDPRITDIWGGPKSTKVYALGERALYVLEGAKTRRVSVKLRGDEVLLRLAGTHEQEPKTIYMLTSQARVLRYRAP